MNVEQMCWIVVESLCERGTIFVTLCNILIGKREMYLIRFPGIQIQIVEAFSLLRKWNV